MQRCMGAGLMAVGACLTGLALLVLVGAEWTTGVALLAFAALGTAHALERQDAWEARQADQARARRQDPGWPWRSA